MEKRRDKENENDVHEVMLTQIRENHECTHDALNIILPLLFQRMQHLQ